MGLPYAMLEVTLPAAAGTYEVRLIGGATGVVVATSNMLRVASSCAAPGVLTINDVWVPEGASGTTPFDFTVSLSSARPQPVTVAFATLDGTATAGSDYAAASGVVTFQPGETNKTVSVDVNGDLAQEPHESFFVELSDVTGDAVVGDVQARAMVMDDDGTDTLTATPSCVLNAGPRSVTVSVSGGPGNPGDWVGLFPAGSNDSGYVDWWYLNGTRNQPPSGFSNATFAAALPAGVATYELRLFSQTTGYVATSRQVEVAASSCTPSFAVNDVSVKEGDTGQTAARFTVSVSPAASQALSVSYATADATALAGSDYVATAGTLTFAPGETSKTLTVSVNGDLTQELHETYVLNLSGPTGGAAIGDGQGIGTIMNDDGTLVPLRVSPSCVATSGSLVVTVTVTGGPGNSGDWVRVLPSGASDSDPSLDWWYLSGTRTQPSSALVNVSFDVTMPAPTGTYDLRLISHSTGSVVAKSNVVSVQSTCTPTIAIDDVSVAEGNAGTTAMNFAVTLSIPSSQTVTVSYATANGTATAGQDYVAASGTLTFQPGDTAQTITVSLNGDATPEQHETFFVDLSGATGNAVIGDPQGRGTIANDDGAVSPIGASPPCVLTSGSRVVTVSVTDGPGNTGDWVALFPSGANNYADWWYLNGTKTQPPSALTSASFDVTMPATAGAYDFRLISQTSGLVVATSNTVTVSSSCGPVLSINDVSLGEGDSGTTAASFTVSLAPASSQAVTVNYATTAGTATAATDYVPTSGTLTFNPGESSKTLAILVNGDTAQELSETFFVDLSGASGATIADAQGQAIILDDDGLPVSASPGCVLAGGPRMVTVTVSGGPGNRGDWVGVFTTGANNSTYLDWWYLNGIKTQPTTGLANASFDATLPAATGTYNFRLFSQTTGFVATSNTVAVSSACSPTLTINDVSVPEGDTGSRTADFLVTLAPASTQTVTVAFATTDGTATAGTDYVAASGTLTFAPGETSKGLSVTVNGDTAQESSETFYVGLSGATGAAAIGDPQGQGTISDDDASQVVSASPSCVTLAGSRLVTITVTGGPGNTGDWIGVFPVAANDSGYVDWWYLNGTKTQPSAGMANAAFNVTMPATSENYNFRLVSYTTGLVVATSNTVSVATSCTPALSIGDVSVPEGNAGQSAAIFTVSLSPASTQAVTVTYTTANGSAEAGTDYVTASGTLVFNPGETSKTLSVLVNGDTGQEASESFLVNLGNVTGSALIGDGQGQGTITNDDAALLTASPLCVTTSGSRSVTVTVAGGPANTGDWVGVFLTGANNSTYPDWWYLNGTRNLPSTGLANASFTITMPATADSYNFRFFSQTTGYVTTSNTVWVAATCTPALSINDVTVVEGNPGTTSASFTVTLAPASSQSVTVNYATAAGTATAGTDYVTASGTLTFNSGESSKAVVIQVNGDTTQESNETFVVDLSGATGGATIADSQGLGTITDDDAPPLSASPTCVVATGTRTVAVTVNGGPGYAGDWVGVFPSGAGDLGYVDWWYLNGTKTQPPTGLPNTSFTVTMPATAGTYNFRLIKYTTGLVVATSNNVSVAASCP